MYSNLVAPYDIAIINCKPTACCVMQAYKEYALKNESTSLAGCVKVNLIKRAEEIAHMMLV